MSYTSEEVSIKQLFHQNTSQQLSLHSVQVFNILILFASSWRPIKVAILDNTDMGTPLLRDYAAISFISIFTPYMYKSYTNTVRYQCHAINIYIYIQIDRQIDIDIGSQIDREIDREIDRYRYSYIISRLIKLDPNILSSSNQHIIGNTLLKHLRPAERKIFCIDD